MDERAQRLTGTHPDWTQNAWRCEIVGHAWIWVGTDTAGRDTMRCDKCGATHAARPLIAIRTTAAGCTDIVKP